MRKIKIMLLGHTTREVFVRPGETFIGLTKRLNSDNWPLLRVRSWYHNNKQAGLGRYLVIVRDGDVFAGVEPIRGSRILGDTPTCHLQLPGVALFPLAFKIGESLAAALQRAPQRIQEAAVAVTTWRQDRRGRPGRIVGRSPSNIILFDNIHVDALLPTSEPTVAGTVTFMVTGRRPKRVCFDTGSTLEMLLKREGAQTNKVYVDGYPVIASEPLLLRDGMKIATAEWR